MIKLYAVRELECRSVGASESLDVLKDFVEHLEWVDAWPEGFDALAVAADGQAWILVDGWEPTNTVPDGCRPWPVH